MNVQSAEKSLGHAADSVRDAAEALAEAARALAQDVSAEEVNFGFMEPDNDLRESIHGTFVEAADAFLEACGLRPNQDARDQLVEVFLPCLRIMCERDHAQDGSTWKMAGWMPQLMQLLGKADRLKHRSWRGRRPDLDSARDIINYAGFFLRGIQSGVPAWGEWGEPGRD